MAQALQVGGKEADETWTSWILSRSACPGSQLRSGDGATALHEIIAKDVLRYGVSRQIVRTVQKYVMSIQRWFDGNEEKMFLKTK